MSDADDPPGRFLDDESESMKGERDADGGDGQGEEDEDPVDEARGEA